MNVKEGWLEEHDFYASWSGYVKHFCDNIYA